jgi:hypothetical protein
VRPKSERKGWWKVVQGYVKVYEGLWKISRGNVTLAMVYVLLQVICFEDEPWKGKTKLGYLGANFARTFIMKIRAICWPVGPYDHAAFSFCFEEKEQKDWLWKHKDLKRFTFGLNLIHWWSDICVRIMITWCWNVEKSWFSIVV